MHIDYELLKITSMDAKQDIVKIYSDCPKDAIEDDAYRRENLVDLIVNTIIENSTSDQPCTCYALYGKWGEGKTSVLNFIKNKLINNGLRDEIVVAEFNPWMISGSDALLKEFFHAIAYDSLGENIRNILEKYGKLLAFSSKHIINLFLPGLGEIVSDDLKELTDASKDFSTPLLEQKKNIVKSIKESRKHLLVFIDDIDRLDKEEIHLLFKLIRQVADFPNTTYFLAMDPAVVAKSLSGFYGGGITDGYGFLEKIVQVPIVLPVIPKNLLKKQIKEGLFPLFSDLDVKTLDELSSTLSDILLTPRLVIRYLNQIAFIGTALKGEVNIVDLCKLEALKLINPQAHLEVYRRKDSLLKVPDWMNYHFNKKEEEEEVKKRYNQAIECIVNLLPEQYRVIFREILDSMFSLPSHDSLALRMDGRVQNEECFPIYFLQAVPDGTMTNKEIESFIASLEKKDNIISELNAIIQKYEWEILNRLLAIIFRTKANNADACSKMSKLCKNLIFVDEREDDENYSYRSHSIIKILENYMIVSNNPGESVVYDDKLCSDIIKYIYSNKDFDFCVKFNAHLDRAYSRISFLEKDYAKTLLDEFLSLTYEKQLSLSQFELMGLYSTMYRHDENAPSKYLCDAVSSDSFDAYTFFTKLIQPELNDEQFFGQMIRFFKKDNVLGLLIGKLGGYTLDKKQSERLDKFSSAYMRSTPKQ